MYFFVSVIIFGAVIPGSFMLGDTETESGANTVTLSNIAPLRDTDNVSAANVTCDLFLELPSCTH